MIMDSSEPKAAESLMKRLLVETVFSIWVNFPFFIYNFFLPYSSSSRRADRVQSDGDVFKVMTNTWKAQTRRPTTFYDIYVDTSSADLQTGLFVLHAFFEKASAPLFHKG